MMPHGGIMQGNVWHFKGYLADDGQFFDGENAQFCTVLH